jgi:arsenate reductase
MQKALKWLDSRKEDYTFHNYKESGIDRPTIETWLKHFPADKLINTKSATYRALTESEKQSIARQPIAIALMMKNASIIKRPLWDFGNGQFFLGWDENEVGKLINK